MNKFYRLRLDRRSPISDPPQVEQLAKVADQIGIPVLCYGIRTDFQGNLFPVAQPPRLADKLSSSRPSATAVAKLP